jgi:SRSO17 transposase
MGLPRSGDAASRFSAYVERRTSVIGHLDRAKPLRDYCKGLSLQLPFLKVCESMGNHDSEIVGAGSVD